MAQKYKEDCVTDVDENQETVTTFKGQPLLDEAAALPEDFKKLHIVEEKNDLGTYNFKRDAEKDTTSQRITRNFKSASPHAGPSAIGKCQLLHKSYGCIQIINLKNHERLPLPEHAASSLVRHDRQTEKERIRTRNRRATTEQVMDPATRKIVYKLLTRGNIVEFNGCISAGKVANVYHAVSKTGAEVAIKVHKMSILGYQDCKAYTSSPFCFRRDCRNDPRQVVRSSAEKEFRNLISLQQAGVNAPKPILLREHVLLTDFIGTDSWPAPKLKDVFLGITKMWKLYREFVQMIWRMYNKCNLIHSDLNEYSLLYYKDSIVIIDLSRSVEREHPLALRYLRKNCKRMTDFFRRKGVDGMHFETLFTFITDRTVIEDDMDEYLDLVPERMEQEENQDLIQEVDEKIFKNAYIPQRLTEVIDIEHDIKLTKSEEEDLMYKTLFDLKIDLSESLKTPVITAEKSETQSESKKDNTANDSGNPDGNDSEEGNEVENNS